MLICIEWTSVSIKKSLFALYNDVIENSAAEEYNLNPENSFRAKCNFIEKSICPIFEDYLAERETKCKEKPCWLFERDVNFYEDVSTTIVCLKARIIYSNRRFDILKINSL